MVNAEGSVEILEELSRMGVVVSIDDFGTGYSSMSYLRRFPIDKLRELGCDQYQGFYRSAAVPADEIEEAVRSSIDAANEPEEFQFTVTHSKLAPFKAR